jgi:hypothetical protein
MNPRVSRAKLEKSASLTVRIPGREKDVWQKVARRVGEDLSEFARKAVRQRVQAVQWQGNERQRNNFKMLSFARSPFLCLLFLCQSFPCLSPGTRLRCGCGFAVLCFLRLFAAIALSSISRTPL